MASTNKEVKEVSPSELHSRYVSEQPIDRHSIEVTDKNKSVFMNAGIDSTCGKKRVDIKDTLTNGTIASSNSDSSNSVPMDNNPADLNTNV